MYTGKRILLIAGGGTLGTYVSAELLRLGATVDVICPEDKESNNKRLTFIKGYADDRLLDEVFAANRYDGIVNFLHYAIPTKYHDVHNKLISNTDHLIFLSSYRVYADLMHPIKEDAPRLLDTSSDEEFLQNENYALSKARCEDYLYSQHAGESWTVVRPVISFSKYRFDLHVYSGEDILEYSRAKKPLLLPYDAKDLVAGVDWAGNSGKLIANLLFKSNAIGECYTISSAENITWGTLAEYYSSLTNLRVEYSDEASFFESYPCVLNQKKWIYLYDRKFNRIIDNSKVLGATGLSHSDLTPINYGLENELRLYRELNG